MSEQQAFWRDRSWLLRIVRDGFGRGFWGFFAFAVITGAACISLKGAKAAQAAFANDFWMLMQVLPRVCVALTIAALIWFMLPRKALSNLLGKETGILALVIAAIAGAITPGGPSSAYALLAVLGAAGADRGALIAFIASWATLGLQRILVWDVPFLGSDFALLRIMVSLPFPIIAGLIARALPFELILVSPSQKEVADTEGAK